MSEPTVSLSARLAFIPALLVSSGAALGHHGQAETGAGTFDAFVASLGHWLTQPDHLLAVAGIAMLVVQLRPGSTMRKRLQRRSRR